MEREQFTFYASFAKAARKIRKPVERCAFYDAVIDFALSGISPEEGSLPDVVEMAMELVAPVLSSARRKAEAGRNGGKNASEKAEAKTDLLPKKQKQGENESKKEGEKEDKKEGEKEKENKCSVSPSSPSSPPVASPVKPSPRTGKVAPQGPDEVPERSEVFPAASPSPESHFSGDLLAAVNEWLSYKREKRQNYQPTGLRTLLQQLRAAADAHGDAAVAQVIRNSMASGYTGITLDRLPAAARRSTVTTAANYVPPRTTKEQIDYLQKLLDEDRI